jgi:ABC-type uncharacterized transport system permease subunit
VKQRYIVLKKYALLEKGAEVIGLIWYCFLYICLVLLAGFSRSARKITCQISVVKNLMRQKFDARKNTRQIPDALSTRKD